MSEFEPTLDREDRNILHQLEINSRAPLSVLSKKLKMNRDTIKYHMKKLEENGIIKGYVALINPSALKKSVYKLFIRLENLQEETEKDIIDYLTKHKKVLWMGKCEGNWDLLVAVYVNNVAEYYDFFMEISTKFNKYIINKASTILVEAVVYKKDYFTNRITTSNVWGSPIDAKLDEIDLQILEILNLEARTPTSTIANKLKLDARTVAQRIKRLEKEKIILTYRLTLGFNNYDYSFYKVSLYMKNFVLQKEKELVEYCKTLPNLFHYLKGVGPWEVELELHVKNEKHLNSIVRDLRTKFGDIIRTYDVMLITDELVGELNLFRH